MKIFDYKFFVVVIIVLGFFFLFSEDTKISNSQRKALNKLIDEIDRAPNFNLHSIDDSLYSLDSLKDKVILINFWATWCGPCRMEIPEFNELYRSYNSQGFEILGVSVSDSKKQLLNFVKAFKVEYPLLYGTSTEINKVMKEYGGVYAVPSSFLINKKGKIIWRYPGAILKEYDPQTFATLVYEIEKALGKVELKDKK